MEDGLKPVSSDTTGIISLYKETMQEERCNKVAFLTEWIEFATKHSCVHYADYQTLYGYAYSTIQTELSNQEQVEVTQNLVDRMKQDRFMNNIVSMPHLMTCPQKTLLEAIHQTVATKEIWEIGLSIYEKQDVEEREREFQNHYLGVSLAVFLKALQGKHEIKNVRVVTIVDYVFLAILKKRYSLIKSLPSAGLIATIPFEKSFFSSLGCFLNKEFTELPAELLEKFSVMICAWFPSVRDFNQMRGSVRSLAGILFRNNGPDILLDGRLLEFILEALDDERVFVVEDGKSCLIEFLCLYLKFCLENKKTLTNHEFASWVIALCERCSSQFRV